YWQPLGVAGNLLLLCLLGTGAHRRWSSDVTFFELNLAVTDFQFVLTLPFGALDVSWPFGKAVCKLIPLASAMSMYASAFFPAAMSMAHFSSGVSSPKAPRAPPPGAGHGPLQLRGVLPEGPQGSSSRGRAKAVGATLWLSAAVATLPHAVFSAAVSRQELCLLKFPELGDLDPQFLLGFVLSLAIISACCFLLLWILGRMRLSCHHPRRRSRVTRSVTILVLCFFVCWLPSQALTAWSIVIKFSLVPFPKPLLHPAALFPITRGLAHTNSGLNATLYPCLVRRESREVLKGI
uniref:G-protein coupled receptors family 1 profile domain-containing protein n=1 Tax=Pelodiscus sinensis TaxID=13735 RepID=K7FMB3_PELSI